MVAAFIQQRQNGMHADTKKQKMANLPTWPKETGFENAPSLLIDLILTSETPSMGPMTRSSEMNLVSACVRALLQPC